MSKTKEVAFEYAKYNTGEVLHITSAHSGANGYFCIGCNSAMIAYFGRRRPHFKHHPNDVDKSQECTWSDETYRHRIAKEILQRLKEVRVPKVSIAVPKEYGGGSVSIARPRTVKASSVLIERYIYEDENGQVRIGKSFDDMGGQRHLLVKPDVLFLDEHNKPLLIIELCATHRTDEEKRMKLMHLGVDAIELLIPKAANPQEIEKNIISSNNSKWLYCNEQAKTKFNPATHLVSNPGAEFTREPEDVPRGETIKCRTFRVNECIRGIKKFMASGDFAERRGAIEASISRTEGNAARANEKLGERNRRARSDAKRAILNLVELERRKAKALEPEEAGLRGEEEAEGKLAEEQESDYRGLEERYYKERDRLISEQRNLEKEEAELVGQLGRRRTELIERIRELKYFGGAVEDVRGKEERLKERIRRIGEEERKVEHEEKLLRDAIEQEERLQQIANERTDHEAAESKRQADDIKRMEAEICEMESKQRRVRESREQLARIKDRAIDARFNR